MRIERQHRIVGRGMVEETVTADGFTVEITVYQISTRREVAHGLVLPIRQPDHPAAQGG